MERQKVQHANPPAYPTCAALPAALSRSLALTGERRYALTARVELIEHTARLLSIPPGPRCSHETPPCWRLRGSRVRGPRRLGLGGCLR